MTAVANKFNKTSILSNSDQTFILSSVAAESTWNGLCNLSRWKTFESNVLTGSMLSRMAETISGFLSLICRIWVILLQLATMASCSWLISRFIRPTHWIDIKRSAGLRRECQGAVLAAQRKSSNNVNMCEIDSGGLSTPSVLLER